MIRALMRVTCDGGGCAAMFEDFVRIGGGPDIDTWAPPGWSAPLRTDDGIHHFCGQHQAARDAAEKAEIDARPPLTHYDGPHDGSIGG